MDFQRCQIRVNQGKGKKDRIVPFPTAFKELLAMHTVLWKERVLTMRSFSFILDMKIESRLKCTQN
ncbi:hypothetical protein [Mechercharimyces sp. CAU 1602]|uniref:hypothetical protein n=1 Tax=Mechercharimyces sp. CAU 1602 TaxID=2973933 RepID=UPI002867C07B|nr:hypothetical protein [Mechercharimyces sp. CAU 1602]